MKRRKWFVAACLLGGLMAVALLSGLHTSAQAVEVEVPQTPLGAELLQNPGFESATGGIPDHWTKYGGTLSQADSPVHGGSYAARFDSSTTSTKWVYQVVTVTEGLAYVFSAWALKNDSNIEEVYLRVSWYTSDDGTGPAIGQDDSTTRLLSDDSAYRFLTTGHITAPVGAHSVRVRMILNPVDGTSRTAYFDDASFQRVSGPEPVADVNVAKSGPNTVRVGDLVTYRIVLSNTGFVTATTVLVTDTLPSAVDFVTQTGSFTFSLLGGVLLWEMGDVATGTRHLITVTGRVTDIASGTLTNLITVTTTASETAAANNTDAWVTTVLLPGQADLGIVKTGPDAVIPGGYIMYHIALSNTGSATATGVRITDTLPAAVDFVTQTSPFIFTHLGRNLVWYLGDVFVGDQRLITITGHVAGTAAITLTNWATATATASETVTTNNTATWDTAIGVSGTATVRITALHYYGYAGIYDEGVRLMNLGDTPADLSGWYLGDEPTDTSGAAFPDGAVLSPGASLWCAKSAVAFADEFGFKPDYETDDTDPTVPELTGSWPGFGNDGDECALFDSTTRLVDVLVYGDSASQAGWSGAAVQPWTPTNAFAKTGQILYRKLDQATGRPVPDTNTADNWAQDPNDHINGRKVQYPGWDLDEFFQTAKVTGTASLIAAVAPDNAYQVIKTYLDGATTSIFIEGYTFENAHLIDAVVSRAQAGVTVTVLLEGEAVTDQERWFCQHLNAAGGKAYFFHNDDDADIHDRYRSQHAKFIILDSEILIVGSENFNYSGLPADDKSNGTWGRRGTFLITDAPGVVAQARAIFDRDLDTAHKDIVGWDSAHPRYGDPTPGFTPTYIYSDWVTYTVHFSQPLVLTDTVLAFEVIQSPENSLRDTDSLLGLVKRAGAGDTILVEQLYEREHWGATDSTPITDPNPRLEAYIAAARRGAAVHILLNGSPDAGPVRENSATCAYVNSIARSEGLDLEAGLGDPLGRGIHNKMVLVWLEGEGGYAHVGSFNGGEVSSKINRELVVQVKSDEVYRYLSRVFETDWWLAHPVFLPLVMRDYTPPAPPVGYVVISEVMYRPGGQSIGNREWIELYNPTNQSIDISGWHLGDAAAPGEYGAGAYHFEDGSELSAGGVIVVAQQAEDFQGVSGFDRPHFEFLIDPNRDDPTVPNMIPDSGWSGFGFALGDGGDKVILRDAGEVDVDVAVYGTASYPSVVPHAGDLDYNWSLERRPPYYDTDDCSIDFVPRYPSTPGRVPLP